MHKCIIMHAHYVATYKYVYYLIRIIIPTHSIYKNRFLPVLKGQAPPVQTNLSDCVNEYINTIIYIVGLHLK